MINSFSVASSHTAASAGAGAAAITLHFNYNSSSKKSNNNNNLNNKRKNSNKIKNNNSILTNFSAPMATSTSEHKSHNTITTTTTAKMFKITKSEVEANHFLMTYPQQQQQQRNKSGGTFKWMSPEKVITSSNTKEPQFIQFNIQSMNSSSSNQNDGNRNSNKSKKQVQSTITKKEKPKSAFIEVLTMPQQRLQQQQKQRTEDQENAFRQIEDVHNYAKLQHHQDHHLHPHQHSISSDELFEEDDDDEDEDEQQQQKQQQQQQQKQHQKNKLKVYVPNILNNNDEDSEEHVEVDVVTVTPTPTTTITTYQHQLQQQQLHIKQLTPPVAEQDMQPEHHARRPMNAFLIFCKRHRAIVKDRNKTLENRAITKILGDWWAALDEQEKQCFTDLAQQNKDAFFNANPNFKWYKLPAPPLRTLATRPSNANSNPSPNDEHQQQQQHLLWESNELAQVRRRNYFKFADETQMGDLSALLSANADNVRNKEYALQQALSETTQFLSAHMPSNNNNNYYNKTNINNNKRGLQPAAVDSTSNSSEEEERGSLIKKLKSTRTCKGKLYQELINSGQLAAIAKKSKCRLYSGSSSSYTTDANNSTPPISPTGAAVTAAVAVTESANCQLLELEVVGGATTRTGRSISHEFDLEEKIKELPALSLDAYLQRKRSTKKKKKFSSSKKQRNANSISRSNINATTAAADGAAVKKSAAVETKIESEMLPAAAACATATAVGSQKRKARKESITRRDVSAIEQEVASILPLTINGCYYFNQTQSMRAHQTATATTTTTTTAAAASSPLSSASSTMSAYEKQQLQPTIYDATSTSDLLILAEVAANRTELSKSN